MTDISTEAVAAQAAAPEPPPPAPAPAPVTPTAAGPELAHTPGGIPVVPLAVSGANTAVGMVAAAGLAGGPVAAMVAATGAAVLGVAAATRTRRATTPARTTHSAVPGGGTSGRRAGGIPSQTRGGAGRSMTGRGRGKASTATGSTGLGRAGQRRATKGVAGLGGSRSAAGRGLSAGGGRLGQVKALRAAQRASAPSRAAQRAQTTAARRSLADDRRQAKAAQRTARAAGKGRAARTVATGLNKAARTRGTLAAKARQVRDGRTAETVAAKRAAVRKAPARRAARRALWRSAARYHRRRVLAALLAGALGVVGALTTPLGRKLRLPWLMYPGRRLWRRMTATAAEQRAARDEEIRQVQAEQEAAADAAAEQDPNEIGDTAERPAHLVPAAPTTEEVSHVSGFNFEEAAAEMEAAANSYEPDGCMEILAMVEHLPEALTSVANTMRILAERSDAEFALEKEVAGGFNEIFQALMTAVSVAEDLGPTFRTAHAQDIARHEDPRNGTEAEKGWNV